MAGIRLVIRLVEGKKKGTVLLAEPSLIKLVSLYSGHTLFCINQAEAVVVIRTCCS